MRVSTTTIQQIINSTKKENKKNHLEENGSSTFDVGKTELSING